MRATIDKAGRVVIPSTLRARAGLEPGTELDVRYEDGEIRIVRDVPRPRLVEVNGRRIARPTVPPAERPPLDIAELLREERDRWPS